MKWDDTNYRDITNKIIKAFYKVHNKLGPGLLEKAYHNALFIELSKDFKVDSEKELAVIYENTEVSVYVPDLLIEDKVIVKVKAVKELNETHKAQLISQLRISKILIGFLVNFTEKELKFKRYDNFYQIEKNGLSLENKAFFHSFATHVKKRQGREV
jgi:GxxExxY protein